jgi:molecular chaperone DnaK
LAYQVEKALADLGDKAPAHERAHCEQLITDIRRAIQEDAPLEKLRELKEQLQQASSNISSAAYGQAQPGGNQPYGGNGQDAAPTRASANSEEDVIDAEFSEE